jgi:hypothetical protein
MPNLRRRAISRPSNISLSGRSGHCDRIYEYTERLAFQLSAWRTVGVPTEVAVVEAVSLCQTKIAFDPPGLTYSVVGETHIPSNITSLPSIALTVSTISERRSDLSSSERRIGMERVK